MVPVGEKGGMRATTQEGMLSILSGFMEPQIHCIVSLDARIDEGRLARAVRLSFDALPVLGSRLVSGRSRPRWQRRTDLDRLEAVTVESPVGMDAAIERVLVRTMDPSVDPLVRVRVLRGPTDTTVVSVCHVAADGTGVQEYAYLLADLYTGLGEGREVPSLAPERCEIGGRPRHTPSGQVDGRAPAGAEGLRELPKEVVEGPDRHRLRAGAGLRHQEDRA